MLCASDDERETDDSRNFTFFSCRIISIFSWCSFIRIATFMRNIFSHVQLHFIQTLYTRQNKKITCLSIPLIRTCTCRIPKGDNNFNKKKKKKRKKEKIHMKDWTTDNRLFGDYRFRRFARKWLHKSCKLKYPFCSVKNYVVKEMINVIRRENKTF